MYKPDLLIVSVRGVDNFGIVSGEEQNVDRIDKKKRVLCQIPNWIDKLGDESAKAQNLRNPITSFEKFSKSQCGDQIYLLIKHNLSEKNNSETQGMDQPVFEPVGLIRIGVRNLYFDYNGHLKNVKNCPCVLDFYIRHRRKGLGFHLFYSVCNYNHYEPSQFAFDRPTSSMLSFLKRHFRLDKSYKQHNHFVIFDEFFHFHNFT